ncbi:MAG TPA: serine/threonine-protein kinase [Longimicrobiales bacterium]|nr:serine/threonine-protein kinase [Longimicrobiales bacterium]
MSRFAREAKLLASLNHPRIASIYSMEFEARTPFLVLELVEGESLDQRLVRGPLTISEAMRVGRQVAEALAAAHDAGVVHRDLKPANVMIAPETLGVTVLDFGIAKTMRTPDAAVQTTGLTRTGTLLGTAPYISPEHLLDEPTDHRADIWAFGCLMFEVLTARSAFAGPTVAATIAAVLGSEPDWKALPERTPERLVGLLRSCLCKDPGRRLAGMQARLARAEQQVGRVMSNVEFGEAARELTRSARARSARYSFAGLSVASRRWWFPMRAANGRSACFHAVITLR